MNSNNSTGMSRLVSGASGVSACRAPGAQAASTANAPQNAAILIPGIAGYSAARTVSARALAPADSSAIRLEARAIGLVR